MSKLQTEKWTLRMAVEKDWEPAMKLAWETFLIFEAEEYSEEGIESFRDFMKNFDGGVLGHTEKCFSQRAQSYAEGAKFFRGLRVNFLNNSVKFCGFCVPQQKYVSRRGRRVTQRRKVF